MSPIIDLSALGNPQRLTQTETQDKLLQRWKYFNQLGHQYSHCNRHCCSLECFKKCQDISHQLIFTGPGHLSGADHLFISSHNLAACCNRLHQASKAESILSDLYSKLLNICQTVSYPKYLRLDALATLDKAVFSLSSQLAFMGKLTLIHALLDEAAFFAESIVAELDNQPC